MKMIQYFSPIKMRIVHAATTYVCTIPKKKSFNQRKKCCRFTNNNLSFVMK